MRRVEAHTSAAFHHASAAHHQRQASEHRLAGEHERAERHQSAAEVHARRAAYAQSMLPDTEQNAVYGRGDGGYDDGGFRRGARDEDRHYGMRRDPSRAIPDPTDGTRGETRSERDQRARPQAPDMEDRGRSPRAR